jgi:uncharacterized membrane protein YcaP (DUF421 family)
MPQWVEVVLRSLLMIILLFTIAKISGKRQISHLSYFDYVSGIILGGIAAITSIDLRVPVAYGVVSIIVFAMVPFLFDIWSMKSKMVRDFVDGKGAVLIKDGKVMEDNMKKEFFTTDTLLKQLRSKNAFKIADVEFAVLEPTGEVNVLLKKDRQPMTLKDFGIKTGNEKEPQTVIMDGEVLDEPLATLGLNRGWLKTELDKTGVAVENVYLGQVDSYGQLTVDLYDDKIQTPKPVEKPLMLATLKKCEADLEGFALATESVEAKQMYKRNANKVDQAIKRVEKYLKH